MKTIRMAGLAAALFAAPHLAAAPASGQDREHDAPPMSGMVLDADEWRIPTPETALRALLDEEGRSPNAPAIAVLRQRFEDRSASELEAFASRLARIIVEGGEAEANRAVLALLIAAGGDDAGAGTPYAGSAKAFATVYESHLDKTSVEAWQALAYVDQVGGVDYIAEVWRGAEAPPVCLLGGAVEASTPPPPGAADSCRTRSEWCSAGRHLLGTPRGPSEEEFEARCIRVD